MRTQRKRQVKARMRTVSANDKKNWGRSGSNAGKNGVGHNAGFVDRMKNIMEIFGGFFPHV